MARKPKETEEKARPSCPQSKLRSLMKTAKLARQNLNSISGALGTEIKEAAEKNHLDKWAFRIICHLDNQEPERLKDKIENLLLYLDISGLNERAAKVERLPMGEEGEEEEERENVRPFRQPTGIAAE